MEYYAGLDVGLKRTFICVVDGTGNRLLIDQALSGAVDRKSSQIWSCEVRHVPALISLIESGIGIGAVPRFSIPQAPHGRLVAVKLTEPQVVRMIGVIKPRGRPLTAAAQALRDLLASPQALVPSARGSRRKRS